MTNTDDENENETHVNPPARVIGSALRGLRDTTLAMTLGRNISYLAPK